MEEHIYFDSGGLAIEGLLEKNDRPAGLIVTHPHPLYGGDMHNPVVEIVRQAFRQHGFATLRFNFRGTGGSQGRFDDGRGEQKDVQAAADYLQSLGIAPSVLAGYSFGAWVNALSATESVRMVMVSPPVAFIDFCDVAALPGLDLVVTGELDDIAPPAQIQTLMPAWNRQATFKIIPGADHFYAQSVSRLADIVGRYAERLANSGS